MAKSRKQYSMEHYRRYHDKVIGYARKYRRDHKDEISERNRWRKLRIRHGITKEQYEQLFESQDGKCAICGAELDKNLAVDHDHRTNMIRGLLCHKCNMALGILEDRIDAVMKYLNKPAVMKWAGAARMK